MSAGKYRARMVVATLALGLIALMAAPVLADITVPIQISPSTLKLTRASDNSVTVHAAIPYRLVNGSVYLESIESTATFADDRGNLVAKFSFAEVAAVVSPPSATLTLRGVCKDGTAFSGTDRIAVKE